MRFAFRSFFPQDPSSRASGTRPRTSCKLCPVCNAAAAPEAAFCVHCGGSLDHVPLTYADPFIGRELHGKYRIRRELARGGMGVIYLAKHREFEIDVAVKVMAAELASDAGMRRRFTDEARAVARVRHPNVVRVLDFGETSSGELFLVMELVRGRSLSELSRGAGALPIGRAVSLVCQLLSGLAEVHAHGMVHRDLKPENMMVEELPDGQEQLKLLDFGLAQRVANDASSGGVAIGTPSYMSPEQALGLSVDARSDLYSACVVLYELLTGERLFPDCEDKLAQLQAHVKLSPPRLEAHAAALGADLTALLSKGLAKKPADRFSTATELADALLELRPVARPEDARQPARLSGTDAPSPAPAEGRAADAEPPAGAVVVVGGPGVGKTAHARAFALRASAAGRRVLVAELPSAALPRPLGVARDLTIAALGARSREEALQSVEREPALDRLGLRALLGGPETEAVDYRIRRREVLSAFVSLLHRRSADVVVEDAHGLDAGSWVLLRALAEDPRGTRLLLTSRTPIEGFSATRPLARPRRTMFGVAPHVREAQVATSAARDRRDGLSRAAVAALEILCASGRAIARADLVAATGLEIDERVLVELGGVVEPSDDGESLRLSSPTVRSELYQQLSPPERRTAHARLFHAARRAGDAVGAASHALSSVGGDDRTTFGDDAVSAEQATQALIRGGDELRTWFDDDNAARAYRAALDLARRADPSSDIVSDARALACERLARLLRYSGDLASAEALLREALSLAARPETRLATLRGLGRLATERGQDERAVHEARTATMLSLRLGAPREIVQAYAELSDALTNAGERAEASTVLREGLAFVGSSASRTSGDASGLGVPLVLRIARLEAQAGAKGDVLSRIEEVLAACAGAPVHAVARWLSDAADLAVRVDAASAPAVCAAARDACLALGDRLGAVHALEKMISREPVASARDALERARDALVHSMVPLPAAPEPAAPSQESTWPPGVAAP